MAAQSGGSLEYEIFIKTKDVMSQLHQLDKMLSTVGKSYTQIWKNTRTPVEKYMATLRHIDRLHQKMVSQAKKGGADASVFGDLSDTKLRAQAKAMENLRKSSPDYKMVQDALRMDTKPLDEARRKLADLKTIDLNLNPEINPSELNAAISSAKRKIDELKASGANLSSSLQSAIRRSIDPIKQLKMELQQLDDAFARGDISQATRDRAKEFVGQSDPRNQMINEAIKLDTTPLDEARRKLAELQAIDTTIDIHIDDKRLKQAIDSTKDKIRELEDSGAGVSAGLRRSIEESIDPVTRFGMQIEELEDAHKKGKVSADAHARTLNFLQKEMKAAEGRIAGGRHGIGRYTNALQQGSYAVQDFVQVMGPLGLSGAFRASANNISQMFAGFGPMAAVAGGIGATAISIMLADILDASKATDKLADAVDSLSETISNMERVADRAFDMRKIIDLKDIEKARSEYEKLSKDIEVMTGRSVDKANLTGIAQLSRRTSGGITEDVAAAGSVASDRAKALRSTFSDVIKDIGTGVGQSSAAEIARVLQKIRGRTGEGFDKRLDPEAVEGVVRAFKSGTDDEAAIELKNIVDALDQYLGETMAGNNATVSELEQISKILGITEDVNKKIGEDIKSFKEFQGRMADAAKEVQMLEKAFGREELQKEDEKSKRDKKDKAEGHRMSDLLGAGRDIQANAFKKQEDKLGEIKEAVDRVKDAIENPKKAQGKPAVAARDKAPFGQGFSGEQAKAVENNLMKSIRERYQRIRDMGFALEGGGGDPALYGSGVSGESVLSPGGKNTLQDLRDRIKQLSEEEFEMRKILNPKRGFTPNMFDEPGEGGIKSFIPIATQAMKDAGKKTGPTGLSEMLGNLPFGLGGMIDAEKPFENLVKEAVRSRELSREQIEILSRIAESVEKKEPKARFKGGSN